MWCVIGRHSLVGLGWIGLDWIGLGWIGLDCIGLDWIGLHCIALHCIGLPCCVLYLAGILDIPIVGQIAKCLQPILVHRESKAKAHKAANDIRERAQSGRWPHILIFPEGTTTNSRALIAFRVGGFLPGVPVQPVSMSHIDTTNHTDASCL
jgi:1-acyl-sn-glycerol-3-phosphate acyltransferase